MKLKNDKTLNIALTAVFACIVFVLSYLGSFVHIGAISFADADSDRPRGIYIGPWAGAFLGAVFGLTVLFTDVTALALLLHKLVLCISWLCSSRRDCRLAPCVCF